METFSMRVLLTNDDGIDAPGLEALARAVAGLGEALIVAPLCEQSGCSHSTTTDSALHLREIAPNRFSVDGTPADCVRVALHRFGPEIDAILSGINSGGNLGADIYHSGTVAAVREAVIHGVRGIAVSHYRTRTLTADDWRRAADWTRPLLEDLLQRPWRPGQLWNINLPSLPPGENHAEVVRCPVDPSPLPLEFERERDGRLRYSGEYRKRSRVSGHDVDVCFSGNIAVSSIRLFE